MKRLMVWILAAGLILCAAGCGGGGKSAPDVPVTELYSEEGSRTATYDDGYVQTDEYAYHVPQLDADTEGARQINQAIRDAFDGDAEEWLDAAILRISWFTERWDNLQTLVIREDTDWGFTDYSVYCYDLAEGTWLSSEQVLNELGIGRESFVTATKEAAQRCFEELFAVPEAARDDFYRERLAWTVSDDNIGTELMLYPDEAGRLAVIVPIGSIAGASWYYHIVYPFEKAE